MQHHDTERVHTYKADQGRAQIHIFHNSQNDIIDLNFQSIDNFSHGHHARSGGGNDTFNFINTSRVKSTVVGRLEDFDYTRDKIKIEGREINLFDPPTGVNVVSFNGEHNDRGVDPQQWLLINTGQGQIFYALEGARVDMNENGKSNNGTHEAHFLHSEPDFSKMTSVKYVDPMNVVPVGFTPEGGMTINDVDKVKKDVLSVINGTAKGDLIGAGLNDDVVRAGGGSDFVWGGSGRDLIFGGRDSDTLLGNNGNDKLKGESGNDKLSGGGGNDMLSGGSGRDKLLGGAGNDTLLGEAGNDKLWGGAKRDKLWGGAGNDRLSGNVGNDMLSGGTGDDMLLGGSGRDMLSGGSGDDRLSGNTGMDLLSGGAGNDMLSGGTGNDRLLGGGGRDRLIGGTGGDDFIFKIGDTGTTNQSMDVIKDFGKNDNIDLRLLDANEITRRIDDFSFSGQKAAANSVWYESDGWRVIVIGDTDGDARSDFKISLLGVSYLDASDFLF